MINLLVMLASVVPSGTTFLCTPTAVWDGDGPVWCAEGPNIRLAGIAAREMDGSCRQGQPCPVATAEASRDALVQLLGGAEGRGPDGHTLVRGPLLSCISEGNAGGARTAARCSSATTGDLSCAMLESGTVERWAAFDRHNLCKAQLTGAPSGIATVRPESPTPASPRRLIATGSFVSLYRNCAAAWAAGAAPLRIGQAGYEPRMDGDGDGVACEPRRRR